MKFRSGAIPSPAYARVKGWRIFNYSEYLVVTIHDLTDDLPAHMDSRIQECLGVNLLQIFRRKSDKFYPRIIHTRIHNVPVGKAVES